MKTLERLREKLETSLHFSLTSSAGVRPAEEAWVVNRASMWSRMGACGGGGVCVFIIIIGKLSAME